MRSSVLLNNEDTTESTPQPNHIASIEFDSPTELQVRVSQVIAKNQAKGITLNELRVSSKCQL